MRPPPGPAVAFRGRFRVAPRALARLPPAQLSRPRAKHRVARGIRSFQGGTAALTRLTCNAGGVTAARGAPRCRQAFPPLVPPKFTPRLRGGPAGTTLPRGRGSEIFPGAWSPGAEPSALVASDGQWCANGAPRTLSAAVEVAAARPLNIGFARAPRLHARAPNARRGCKAAARSSVPGPSPGRRPRGAPRRAGPPNRRPCASGPSLRPRAGPFQART